MTYASRGIFIEALGLQWEEGSMPATSEEWRDLFADGIVEELDVLRVMDAFPLCDDGRRRNARLERERGIADEIIEKRSKAGKIGNEKRWGSQTDRTGIANGSHSRRKPSPQTVTVTSTVTSSPSGRGPRAPRTGPHAELIQHWERRWLETRGKPYAVEAKDGAAAAAVLKLAGGDLQEATRRADVLLEHSETWMAQNASLSLLRARWNQLAVKVMAKPRGALQNLLDGVEAMGLNGSCQNRIAP